MKACSLSNGLVKDIEKVGKIWGEGVEEDRNY